jgi:hypothetical protein
MSNGEGSRFQEATWHNQHKVKEIMGQVIEKTYNGLKVPQGEKITFKDENL